MQEKRQRKSIGQCKCCGLHFYENINQKGLCEKCSRFISAHDRAVKQHAYKKGYNDMRIKYELGNYDKQIRKEVVQEIREIFDFDNYENEIKNPEIRVSYKLFKKILKKVEGGENGKID